MKKFILAIICVFFLIPSITFADNNMRDYIPAPSGVLANLVYYFHIDGDELNSDGDKVADVDFKQDLWLLREVYYFDLGPFQANAQVIIPFGSASLEVGGAEQDSSGLGDIMVLGTVWLLNKPEDNLYLAFSPYVFLPTGEYDHDQAVNMGSNRWAFRGEFNLTKGFEVIPDHKAYFEVTAGMDIFGTNDDYMNGHDYDQDPLFNLESHLSYDLTKELVISADYYGHWGGSVDVDDSSVDNSETNSQTVGGTLAWNFAPGWQLLGQYQQNVYNENGIEAKVYHARVLYAF